MGSSITNLEILRYVEGQCSGPEAQALAQAMETDPELRKKVSELQESLGLYRSAFEAPAALPSLTDRIMADLESEFEANGFEEGSTANPPLAPNSECPQKIRRLPVWRSRGWQVSAAAVLLVGISLVAVRSIDLPWSPSSEEAGNRGSLALMPVDGLEGGVSGAGFSEGSEGGALVESDDGARYVSVSMPVPEGTSRLLTLPESPIGVSLGADGTILLDGDSELRLEGESLELVHGRAILQVTTPTHMSTEGWSLDLDPGEYEIARPQAIGDPGLVRGLRVAPRSGQARARRIDSSSTIGNPGGESSEIPVASGEQIILRSHPQLSDPQVSTQTRPVENPRPTVDTRTAALLAEIRSQLRSTPPGQVPQTLEKWILGDAENQEPKAPGLRNELQSRILLTLARIAPSRAIPSAEELLGRLEGGQSLGSDALSQSAVSVLHQNRASEALLAALIQDSELASSLRTRAWKTLDHLNSDAAETLVDQLDSSASPEGNPKTQRDPALWDSVPESPTGASGQPWSPLQGVQASASLANIFRLLPNLSDFEEEQAREKAGLPGSAERFDQALLDLETRFGLLAATAQNIVYDARTTFFVQRLLESKEPVLWVAALSVLHRVVENEPEIFEAIETVLRAAPDVQPNRARIRVAAALHGALTEQHLPSLIDFIQNERHPAVRYRLTLALAQLKGNPATNLLAELMRSDSDVSVRFAALEGLVQRRHPSAVEGVRLALLTSDPDRRHLALTLAATYENDEFFGDLSTALLNPRSTITERHTAAVALGNSNHSQAYRTLLRATQTSSRPVAEAVGISLGRIAPQEGIDGRLTEYLANPSTNLWLRTGILIGLISQPEKVIQSAPALDAIRKILNTQRLPWNLREAAAKVVESSRAAALRTEVRRLLGDENPRVRVAAAKALFAIGDRDGVGTLVSEAVHQEDTKVLERMLRGLEQIAPHLNDADRARVGEGMEQILPQLASRGLHLEFAALRLLYTVEYTVPDGFLTSVLERDWDSLSAPNRVAAALVLHRQGSPGGLERLKDLFLQVQLVETVALQTRVYRDEVSQTELDQLHLIRQILSRDQRIPEQMMVEFASKAITNIRMDPTGRSSLAADLSELSDADRIDLVEIIDEILVERRRTIDQLSETLLYSNRTDLRNQAAIRLGWIASPDAVEALSQARSDPTMRQTASQTLEKLGFSPTSSLRQMNAKMGTDPALQLERYRNLLIGQADLPQDEEGT